MSTCPPLRGSCGLRRALLVPYLAMVAYLPTCIILYTGFPSGSVCYTGSALSSCKASWVQLLATYAPSLLSLRLLRVAQPSVPLLGVTFWFHLLALLLCSAEHSLLLVQQRGLTCQCHLSFAYLLMFTRLPFTPY